MESLSFRPAAEADVPFLVELRFQTMTPHEVASGLIRSPEESLRRVHAAFHCAEVVIQAGRLIGLLKVIRNDKQWELMQIQLSPEVQGRGLGTQLLRSLIAQARAERASLRLSVLKANPARRLYERLGFVVVQEKELSYEMALRT